jgi:hypothetical protein
VSYSYPSAHAAGPKGLHGPGRPDMRESLQLDLVDADEDEEGRDRLPTALKRDIKPAAGGTFSSRASIDRPPAVLSCYGLCYVLW